MENLINTENIIENKILSFVHIKSVIKENFHHGSEPIKIQPETITESSLDIVTDLFKPSDLVIIAARPAIGKTSFSLNIGVEIALKKKLPIVIFSLEMSKEQMTQRIISSESKVSSYQLKTKGILKDQEDNFKQAIGKLSNSAIYG